jgi:hypothetical protein
MKLSVPIDIQFNNDKLNQIIEKIVSRRVSKIVKQTLREKGFYKKINDMILQEVNYAKSL